MTAQLVLPLELTPQLTADHFYVSASNQDAWNWLQAWPQWPTPGLVIYGPPGCGKTHLGHIFQEKTGALWLAPSALLTHTPASLLGESCCWIVDSLDTFLEEPKGKDLFLLQLYNLFYETSPHPKALLFLAKAPPARLSCALPDLASRLNTLPAIGVQAPDDALLSRLLSKLLSDLQLQVPEFVITYLLNHMERSFAGAQKVVSRLNELSLQRKRAITIDLCRQLF